MNLTISGFLRCLSALLFLGISLQAQDLTIRIKLPSDSSSHITIEADYPPGADQFSFLNSYAGVVGLGERFGTLTISDDGGEQREATRIAPGEFRSATKTRHFKYEADLALPETRSNMAHVSWLNHGRGLMMLNDLVPAIGPTSRTIVEFSLPRGWNIGSATPMNHDGRYVTAEPDKAVFFVGESLRKKARRIASIDFSLVTVGQWSFSDEEVIERAERVVSYYRKRMGFQPPGSAVLMLAPFPDDTAGWSAETRGSTVMLVLSSGGNRRDALARLEVIFTHELFHLWVPNGLNLVGDYDWFFEGFTLYEALKASLRLGLIDFREYLKTISRVYNSYLSNPDRDRLPLIELSKRRWTSGSSLVYDKGMLLAFLCDLALLDRSRGKESLETIYRELFQASHYGHDGNEVIINLMSARESLKPLISYIQDKESIELDRLVSAYGLRIESMTSGEQLLVRDQLSLEQRQLLRSLEFNK